MKNINCNYEETIIESKKNDDLNIEQKEHIKNCSVCSDSLMVLSWMNQFDKIGNKELEQAIPNSDKIWEQAFTPVQNKKDLIKKAMRPLDFAQFATYITAFFGIVLTLFGKSPFLNKFFVNIADKSGFINSLTTIFDSFAKTLPFLIVPLGMVSLLLISYFIYSIFDPENA